MKQPFFTFTEFIIFNYIKFNTMRFIYKFETDLGVPQLMITKVFL